MPEVLQCDIECVSLACDAVYAPEDELPGLLKEKYRLIQIHLADSKFDASASSYLIAKSESAQSSIFVVFRGTKDLSDMIADFNCQPREIDDAGDMDDSLYVHGGIYETAKQSVKSIVEVLNGEHQSHPITDVFLTGHSLGGACAMAARFVLQQQNDQSFAPASRKSRRLDFAPKFHVVTFGAPLLFSHGAAISEQGSRIDTVSRILKHKWMHAMQVSLRSSELSLPPSQPLSLSPPVHPPSLTSLHHRFDGARLFRPTDVAGKTSHVPPGGRAMHVPPGGRAMHIPPGGRVMPA